MISEESCVHGIHKPPLQPEVVLDVLHEVYDERARQDERWGEQNHPDGTGGRHATVMAYTLRIACDNADERDAKTWAHVLTEEVAEALAESDLAKLRAELVQVCAVAVNWAEAIDRRSA